MNESYPRPQASPELILSVRCTIDEGANHVHVSAGDEQVCSADGAIVYGRGSTALEAWENALDWIPPAPIQAQSERERVLAVWPKALIIESDVGGKFVSLGLHDGRELAYRRDGDEDKLWADAASHLATPEPAQAPVDEAPKEYEKIATIRAQQFLPDRNQIPEGVKSSGLGDPRTDPSCQWIISTLENNVHYITPGDWIATGVEGEKWAIKDEIFHKTYRLVVAPKDGGSHAK